MLKALRKTPSHKPRKTTLFLRISLRMILPFLLLIVAFITIQLANQLSFLNKVYEIQSRVSLQQLTDVLGKILEDPQAFDKELLLRAKIENAKEHYNVSGLLILDPLTRETLYSDREEGFLPQDLVAAERSLLNQRAGKPPFFEIDKVAQKLNAYVPLAAPVRDRIYIAKVSFALGNLRLALERSMGTLLFMFFLTLFAGILIAGGLAQSIVKPIQSLNLATRDILKGELGHKVVIHTGDEIEELAETFNQMSGALKEMKERAEDANPLTQLPGNQGIYYEVQRRIYERQKLVFFHIDIDRFKIFNDHYGLARGDDVIKKTAKVLRDSVNEKGSREDFLGHQGGDDFVLLIAPSRAAVVAELVIQKFDGLLKGLYRKDDYERGYILEQDRRTGVEELVQFPLMAISLAGIANTKRDFADYFDLLSRAVDVKKKVKRDPQSSYLIEE